MCYLSKPSWYSLVYISSMNVNYCQYSFRFVLIMHLKGREKNSKTLDTAMV